jgi:hypothetical protein
LAAVVSNARITRHPGDIKDMRERGNLPGCARDARGAAMSFRRVRPPIGTPCLHRSFRTFAHRFVVIGEHTSVRQTEDFGNVLSMRMDPNRFSTPAQKLSGRSDKVTVMPSLANTQPYGPAEDFGNDSRARRQSGTPSAPAKKRMIVAKHGGVLVALERKARQRQTCRPCRVAWCICLHLQRQRDVFSRHSHGISNRSGTTFSPCFFQKTVRLFRLGPAEPSWRFGALLTNR